MPTVERNDQLMESAKRTKVRRRGVLSMYDV